MNAAYRRNLLFTLTLAVGSCTGDAKPDETRSRDAAVAGNSGMHQRPDDNGSVPACRTKPDGWEKPLAPPTPNGPPFCLTDHDCPGAGGHCTTNDYRVNILKCVYDECFSDDDCAPKEKCDCRATAQRCVTADCRDDRDCNGERCRPTYGCGGSVVGVAGFYCTTSGDTCRKDSDCAENMFCKYEEELKSWRCAAVTCVGRPG